MIEKKKKKINYKEKFIEALGVLICITIILAIAYFTGFIKGFTLKDMQNVINTEFESVCYDKGLNKDAFETRYVLVNELENKEKIKAIHVSASKAELAKKEQQLEQLLMR